MIVFCHLLNDRSGSPIILRDAIGVLVPDGKQGMLFVGSQGRGALEAVNTPIHRYWYRRSRFRFLTLFSFMFSQACLYRALTKAGLPKNSIIYVNTLLPFGAAIWARRNQSQVLYHIHESSISPRLLQRFLVLVAEKTANFTIFVSEDNRKRMLVNGVRSAVVSNPISAQIVEVGNVTPYAPRRSGKFEILMLASPREFKGVPEFIKLARCLVERHDIHFTLVLNGGAREIEEYTLHGALPTNIDVHPRTDAPERFYAKGDILLNLSRIDQCVETFGLTLVEGMAFGLPVIAPPVGGPTEIITDGREGYLIDSRDSAKLEQTIRFIADSPDLAEKLSIAARSRAAQFNLSRFAESLRTQIDKLAFCPATDRGKQ